VGGGCEIFDPKGALASAVAALVGGMLIVLGIYVIRASPTLIRLWIAGDRWFRRLNRRLLGTNTDWYPLELQFRRFTYWWIPRDVELTSPDDMYSYLLSERFRSHRIVRLWYGIASTYFAIVGGLLIAMAVAWLLE
jgi:hypothetical protein